MWSEKTGEKVLYRATGIVIIAVGYSCRDSDDFGVKRPAEKRDVNQFGNNFGVVTL